MRFSLNSTTFDLKKQSLFLILVVLAVYCRAATGAIVSIDDVGIMKFYGSGGLGLFDAIMPGQGYYYRPVIALSFYLDHLLLGQNPILLHLENILIHAANAALVLALASRLLPASAKWPPFIAALIFALHPVNAEGVSWIAGRTDPLAALFVLLACLSLLNGLETGGARHAVATIALFMAGVMTKETAVAFIPASLMLIALWRRLHPGPPPQAFKLQVRILVVFYICISVIIGAVLLSRAGSENSLAKLLSGNVHDLGGSLALGSQLLGFYLKKMFVPWPLNFAITEVSIWYFLPAAAGLLLFCWRARDRDLKFVSICIGLLFLLPAIVVGVCDVAWTVAAERYLYIPSAFFAIGLAGYLSEAQWVRRQRLALAVALTCIVGSAFSTWHRTGIWQSNIALFEDSIAKSPGVGMLHHELAVAYAKKGRIAEAEKELDVASSLDISEMLKGMIRKDRLLVRLQGAPPEEKRRLINLYGWNLVREDRDLLELLRANDYLILPTLATGAEREALVSELVRVSERLFTLTGDAILLYNNGQLLLDGGDRRSARTYFARCAESAADGLYFKASALKLAATLGGDL